jgi:hypothetical protein
MAQTQAHQRVEPSAGLEFIESAESPEHLLAEPYDPRAGYGQSGEIGGSRRV